MKIQWISTTENEKWQPRHVVLKTKSTERLEITNNRGQIIDGFGGCFNELGQIALLKLSQEDRSRVMRDLFDEEGAAFNFCRMPIGASDYAQMWYSHNEIEDDLLMENHTIERDHKYLLPFIKSAIALQPEMQLFASPWSPPTWMKFPRAYNNGRLIMKKEILDAYALYFKRFIDAYGEEGIKIDQIHIQNEPFANQKFPSCVWSAEQFRVFIGQHLGPLFSENKLDTEIWLGTLNGPTEMDFTMAGITLDLYDKYVDEILFDKNAIKYISGLGYQWAGQQAIQRTHESFPELKLMQTENECGDGTNTWTYAQYVFNLMRHYITNGVNSYIYWNMVLEPGGISTWGWPQNALITVDPETKKAIYNPEFYVMKHFSKFVKKGATRLETKGHWSGASLVFENPDESKVIVISNALDYEREATISVSGEIFTIMLLANSFNTLVIELEDEG